MLQPMTPPAFFVEKPTTDAGKRAAELHQDWQDRYARFDQIDAERTAAHAEVETTGATMRDVLAQREQGDATDADVKAAEDAHTVAKAEANAPWQDRQAAARQAAEQARSAYADFVNANLDELVTELYANAKAAVDTIIQGAQTFLDGFAQYQGCREAGQALIGPAQLIDGQSIPILQGAVNEAKAAVERLLEDRKGLNVPVPEERFLRYRRRQLGIDGAADTDGEG